MTDPNANPHFDKLINSFEARLKEISEILRKQKYDYKFIVDMLGAFANLCLPSALKA